MLLIPNVILFYTVSNSYTIIIISFLILFNFSFVELNIILIPFLLSIFIGMSSIFFLNERITILNYILFLSVTGFTFGEKIMEIIFIYFKIIKSFEIWIIILIFTIIFNLLLFFSKKIVYIICSSLLCSYFISNIYIISISKKLPIWTIVYSLVEEGFNINLMNKFIYKKYYIYFIIYFISFIAIIGLKLFILLIDNIKFGEERNENSYKEERNKNINKLINNIDNKI